jgi:hypothetical protein
MSQSDHSSDNPSPSADDVASRESMEPVLAGTLCLLTLNVLRQVAVDADAPAMNAFVCRKIASNLRQLSCHATFSSDFRRLCDRLVRRWEDEFGDAGSNADAPEHCPVPMPASATRH